MGLSAFLISKSSCFLTGFIAAKIAEYLCKSISSLRKTQTAFILAVACLWIVVSIIADTMIKE